MEWPQRDRGISNTEPRRSSEARCFTLTRFNFDLAAWFTDNADQVRRDLQGYFGGGTEPFTGRWFEEFAAIGDPNRFEASDVLAVAALSVEVPPEAAAAMLITDTERFNALLRLIPREQNLWEVRRLDVNVGSPADDLHGELRTLRGVDWVVARQAAGRQTAPTTAHRRQRRQRLPETAQRALLGDPARWTFRCLSAASDHRGLPSRAATRQSAATH
jgi:hypothetical protein